MSRYLSALLGAEEPGFTLRLRQLERLAYYPKTDIYLMSDIIAHVNQKYKELGLDPHDTTGSELYHALIALAGRHNDFLVHALGCNSSDGADRLLLKLKHTIDALPVHRGVWAMKTSDAKKVIKQIPPKNVMKYLHYRSVDSLLKREDVVEILLVASFAESKAWHEKRMRLYKALEPKQFEIRDIRLIALNSAKWSALTDVYVRKSRHNILSSKEMGAIGILPLPASMLKGVALVDFALILHHINELRTYSTYFKFNQVKGNFGEVVSAALQKSESMQIELAGRPLHWRVLQRSYGKVSPRVSDVFELRVHPEDFAWVGAAEMAYNIEPAFSFWKGMDYVGISRDGHPVSFNLLDVAINYCNGLPYGAHTAYNLRTALHMELEARYIAQVPIEKTMATRLDE